MSTVVMGPRYTERKQLSNSYISRDLGMLNEPSKQVHRDCVLKHFKQFHPQKKPKLFSLPARWWMFETQFLKAFPGAEFVAVERNHEILQYGVTYMPGEQKHHAFEPLKSGSLYGHWSSRAKILKCDASTFMETNREDLPANRVSPWNRNYKGWTCAWWDLMSNLGDESIRCLLKTELFLDRTVAVCPVSITLFCGREVREITTMIRNLVPEDVDPIERRVLALQRWLNKFNRHRHVEVTDVFPYLGETSRSRMVLINTLFRQKSSG